jgi:hypothetical protein
LEIVAPDPGDYGCQTQSRCTVALTHITKGVQRAVSQTLSVRPEREIEIRRQLDQERRKLQNLVTAIEGGSVTPVAVLNAISEREASINKMEGELRKANAKPQTRQTPELADWVRGQLGAPQVRPG